MIGELETVSILGKVSRKKSSCFFGFCTNQGGEGSAQVFCPLLTNCIYWVNLGMRREGETPAQIILANWRSKEEVQVVQIIGGSR